MLLGMLLVVSAASAVYYGLVALPQAASPVRSFSKTLAIAALSLISIAQGGPWLLVAALALSALGDLCLSFENDKGFLAGMLAFFLAHVAYVPLFMGLGGGLGAITQLWPVALVLAFYAIGFYRFLFPGLGDFRMPVAGYSLAIAAMGMAALGLVDTANGPIILFGVALFLLSDSILAMHKFRPIGGQVAGKIAPNAVWVTYYAAQALIAYGVLAQ